MKFPVVLLSLSMALSTIFVQAVTLPTTLISNSCNPGEYRCDQSASTDWGCGYYRDVIGTGNFASWYQAVGGEANITAATGPNGAAAVKQSLSALVTTSINFRHAVGPGDASTSMIFRTACEGGFWGIQVK
ncbi:hypothetical protein V490_03271 [Pseudogymnoascus sp. VKM F-3557]|nr:hypothetical protein V490_03271 [Pseudogymnoascus sp. VKM F-3557]